MFKYLKNMVGAAGFEPATSTMSIPWSIPITFTNPRIPLVENRGKLPLFSTLLPHNCPRILGGVS